MQKKSIMRYVSSFIIIIIIIILIIIIIMIIIHNFTTKYILYDVANN